MDENNMNNEVVNEVAEAVAEPVAEAVVEAVAEPVQETVSYDYSAAENSYNYVSGDEVVKTGGNGLAIAAMVCGIVADVFFLLSFCCLLFRMIALFVVLIVGVAGLVMGIIAKKKGQKKGFWLTAIICSSVSICFVIITFVLAIIGTFLSASFYSLPFFGALLESLEY